jgi:hypothetical protein
MGELMEGKMQQAAQLGRQFMVEVRSMKYEVRSKTTTNRLSGAAGNLLWQSWK